jgi:uncharacterized protein (DUF885 family)
MGAMSGRERNVPAISSFVDDYFNALFEWSPTSATAAGLHQYDTRIEDFSGASFRQRIQQLKELESQLAVLRRGALSPDDEIDAEILDGQIRAELLDLEVLETWRRNPMHYVSLPGSAVDGLMKRNFAAPAERLRAIIARLKGVPAMLSAMRENVSDPPRELTDLAFRIAHGSVGFFRREIADWAKAAAGEDASLLQEFEPANDAAARSMEEAAAWLDGTLRHRSNGQYAIGPQNFAAKLLYEEMVDTPIERLLSVGEANLEKDYRDFLDTARRIDPNKSPAEVMKSISDEHPTEQSLIEDARNTIEEIVAFIRAKNIVTISSDVRPTIIETPPYMRSGTFAAMDTPGPYETNATEAFYYVTPPEPEWDAQHKEEHLRLYNPPVMKIITVHEAYPGHYIQFLNAKSFPTKTRKIIACGTNAEGWAHYTEQMLLEEGYGGTDPRIRIAQLHEALLRDARWVVGIRLHCSGWTVEQGAKFFEEKAFQEPANAYEEARRGAYNPTYLYYTLGKLQIYKLREDYRRAKGSAYRLQQFHDEFVRQGSIPIKAIRRIMLPGDAGATL